MNLIKLKVLILLIAGLNLNAIAQKNVEKSIWQGRIGTKRVVLELIPDSLTKQIAVFFNFPEEFSNRIRAISQKVNKDSLCAIADSYYGSFKGCFSENQQFLSGVFERNKKATVITLKKVDKIGPLVMPQTPIPPFPYKTENVIYIDTVSGIRFGATLSLPKVKFSCPVVVIVSGTGKQDRDGTMAGHKMFTVIADYLTRRGIAVLRVDDRGIGETTGNYEKSTTEDFAKDVLSSIQYLKTRKEIDITKIGLIGHSEGGAVISIVASQSKDVAFMISIAGLAMKGLDALRKQNADIVAASSLSENDKKRSNNINELMFKTVFDNVQSDSLEQIINRVYNDWKKQDDAYFKTLNLQFDHFRFPIYSYAKQASGRWYRYFIQYDPAKTLGKIMIPVLAINGDMDRMVACKENLTTFEKYLTLAGNKDFQTVVMPGVNHLFQHCRTGDPSEYSTLDESFAPEVLALMGDWILKHTKQN